MSSQYYRCNEHIVSCQHVRGYYRSTAHSQEEELRLAVKEYVPLDNLEPQPGDATIIACHATGLIKELYEPLFDEILRASHELSPTFRIRAIWIADTASHGASSVLNEGKLGIDACWDDHARDLLHMINHFRMPRPLVGLGHSMGGTNILQLALLHPRLLSTVICIEPITSPPASAMNFAPAYWLGIRKDIWSSREEAIAEARRSPFQKAWDDRVKDLWALHALRELPTLLYPEAPDPIVAKSEAQGHSVPVTLTVTRHHDARSFARGAYPLPGEALASFQPDKLNHPTLTKEMHDTIQCPIYRPEAFSSFEQLPCLRPSCLYIYGPTSPFLSATPKYRADKLAVTGTGVGGSGGAEAGKVHEVVLKVGGHFVPFEKPGIVAKEVSGWLSKALEVWREEEETQKAAWDRVGGSREKAMIEEEWLWWTKEQYGIRKPKPKEDKKVTKANL